MGDLDLAALKPAQELDVVVAGYQQRGAVTLNHSVDDRQHVTRTRPTIDEIANEDNTAAGGRPRAGDGLPNRDHRPR